MASGSRPQARTSLTAASGSAAIRPVPTALASILTASASLSSPRTTVASPLSRASGALLVISMADPAVPGNNGRIWAGDATSSATISTLRPAS
jgi:poly(3-hydroxybutyrate) depolymerase